MNGRSVLMLLPEITVDRCRGPFLLLHAVTLLCVGIKQRGPIFLSVSFPFHFCLVPVPLDTHQSYEGRVMCLVIAARNNTKSGLADM